MMEGLDVDEAARTLARQPLPRIGFLALGGLGGSGRVACDVARGLARRGHPTFFLTGANPHWASDLGRAVPHVDVGAPSIPTPSHPSWVQALTDELVREVQRLDLQVLSVHYGVGLAQAAIAAKQRLQDLGRTLRVCVTLHGTDVSALIEDPEQCRSLARALESADEVTTVSAWLSRIAREKLGLRRVPRVIPNGVDLATFFPRRAFEPLGSVRPLTLCHVSNFRPVKRPLDCLEILANLGRRGIDASLHMIGEGPLLEPAKRRARAADVRGRAEFRPPIEREELANALASADVVLVPSESESFGLVALEAMASGTIVVGSRCGGLEELLSACTERDLSAELLAAPGDIEAQTDRVESLARDPRRYATLLEMSVRIGRTHFDRETQLSRYAETLVPSEARAKAARAVPRGSR